MEIVSLSSGSKGNSLYAHVNGVNILVDVGISMKKINQLLLINVGIDLDDIDLILITHRHSDHVQSLHTIVKKYPKIKVISHKDVWEDYLEFTKKYIDKSSRINIDKKIEGEKVTIKTFKLNHDVPCYGYHIIDNNNKERLTFIADNGGIKFSDWDNFKNSEYYVVESNHDITMEINNQERELLTKRRSLSFWGHTDNKSAMDFVMYIVSPNTKGVLFHHLSQDCNSEELAKMTHMNLIRIWGNVRKFQGVDIKYARQDEVVRLV